MTPPRSEPFEAAVRALVDAYCVYAVEAPGNADITKADWEAARACLATALPPDPAPETIAAVHDEMLGLSECLERGVCKQLPCDCAASMARALRASLLPGEELS